MDAELKKLIEKAEAGNIKAAAWAGDCFNKGIFTEKDDVKAYKYYLMAAQGGHAQAAFMVGLNLLFGTGVDKNIPEGLKYIQKAADDNVAEAQYMLALCYGDEQKSKYLKGDKSFFYLEKSAQQGWAPAQVLLGDMYYTGEGVKGELGKAIFWFCCAYLHKDDDERIEEASLEAKERIDFLIQNGMPGGWERIKEVTTQIKREYPQYISFDRVEKSEAKNDENAKYGGKKSFTSNEGNNVEARNRERNWNHIVIIALGIFVLVICGLRIFLN